MYSSSENIFEISAPLAVFNSSICSQTLLNDSNNNKYEKINLDELLDEDIFWIYKKNSTQHSVDRPLEIGMRARFRWKKLLIIVIFVKLLQLKAKKRIPQITVTYTTPILPKSDQNINEFPTPVKNETNRFVNSIISLKKTNEKVFNNEGSFIFYQSISSATSFIRTPRLKLFNVDLKTPTSDSINQNRLFTQKKKSNSIGILNNLSTPVVSNYSRGRNLLAVEQDVIKSSYSYSSIPYIDQEELDKIIKSEYNVHMINLCHIDDCDNVYTEKSCQNCIDNLIFIFKTITLTVYEYITPSIKIQKQA